MALEPHEESRDLIVTDGGGDLPSPVNPTNTDVVSAGAVAAGVIAAALAAGGIALGRTLIRSIAQARRRDEQRAVTAGVSDTGDAVVHVTRVSMVVVEEWVSR